MLDGVAIIPNDVKAEGWRSYYARLLNSLQPSVTEVLIHPEYNGGELRTAFGDKLRWARRGANSDEFVHCSCETIIKLITWREISNGLH